MRPLTVKTYISAPREDIFDFLADFANRPSHCDHFELDYRLARANSVGVGAAARFKLDPPLVPKTWVEIGISELDRPRLVVEEGRYMRWNRSLLLVTWELVPETTGVTRVELTVESRPATRIDALKEGLGARGWLKRQSKKSLERLRMIFEERPSDRLARASVAGYEANKAPRFGAHIPAPRTRQGSG
jgi:uncharacterized protein YndB with AHSA1/START domain